MKTIWILIVVIASFWLTLFLSNVELGKRDKSDSNFRNAVLEHTTNLPQCWDSDCESGFIFKTLSEEQDPIQIVLGFGRFESNEGLRFQEKLNEMEASNINPRII